MDPTLAESPARGGGGPPDSVGGVRRAGFRPASMAVERRSRARQADEAPSPPSIEGTPIPVSLLPFTD